jgi:hypothetical protein
LEELLLQPVFKNYSTRITVQRIIYRTDVTEYRIRDEVSSHASIHQASSHMMPTTNSYTLEQLADYLQGKPRRVNCKEVILYRGSTGYAIGIMSEKKVLCSGKGHGLNIQKKGKVRMKNIDLLHSKGPKY